MGRMALRYISPTLSKKPIAYMTITVQSPTGSDYSAIATVPDSEPWKDGEHASTSGKYKYHPYNDVNRPVKDAPSALNVVVVPNVSLPKVRCQLM